MRAKSEVQRLEFLPPYAWPQVLAFYAARAIAGVEVVEGQRYTRAVRTEDGHAVISVALSEDENALELTVSNADGETVDGLLANVRRVFDLTADPARIARTFWSDERLVSSVKKHGGLRIPGVWDPFECAARAVLGQQISVTAARTFGARLVRCAGTKIEDAASAVTHLFPTAKEIAEANLIGIGLTGARVSTLKALAVAVTEGAVDFNSSAAKVICELQSVPGIGPWTAQYVALRGLGDRDAFPAGDLVLRRMASGGSTVLSVREMENVAESWRPWRGYAAQHLWQSASDSHSK
jgi:AraC family transcriptional regulator of adaptative response / DNA-3-methyladenine glycosylase II